MMEKKEFLSICDSTLKEMGFSKEGVERWLLPALHGGKQYILDNWKKYSFHHLSEMVHTALEQWSISGELPAKQNH